MFTKFYLELQGHNEVRYLEVNELEKGNFTMLKARLEMEFPRLKKTNFGLYWIDADLDRVKVGSDAEYKFMWESANGKIKTVYIVPEDYPTDKAGTFHPGVVCDGCSQDIFGYRYKCLSCPNIDLCTKCESLGFHPEHFVLRMPVPLQFEGRWNRKSGKWFHKLGKKQCGEHWKKHCHGSEKGAKLPTENSNFIRTEHCPFVHSNLGEYLGIPQIDLNFGVPNETDNSQPSANSGFIDASRLLGALREGIANFLDPLGKEIMAQAGMGTQGQKQETTEKSEEEQTAMETEETVAENAQANKNFEAIKKESSVFQNIQPQADNKNESNKQELKERHPFLPPDSSWTVIENVASPPGPSTSAVPPNNPIPLIALPAASAPQQLGPSTSTAQPNNPIPLIALPPASAPRNNVDDALEKMLVLGFNNEGDWLRRLLEVKNGNIEEVLDFLMPFRKPN